MCYTWPLFASFYDTSYTVQDQLTLVALYICSPLASSADIRTASLARKLVDGEMRLVRLPAAKAWFLAVRAAVDTCTCVILSTNPWSITEVLASATGSGSQAAFACQLNVGCSSLECWEIGCEPGDHAGLSEVERGLGLGWAEPGW